MLKMAHDRLERPKPSLTNKIYDLHLAILIVLIVLKKIGFYAIKV